MSKTLGVTEMRAAAGTDMFRGVSAKCLALLLRDARVQEHPAGAVLFVDGAKTAGEGEERSFFTPPLEPGQKYFYDVRVEVAIDGKKVSEEKRVIVEAGAEIRESFPKMTAAIAAARTVAGK